LPLSRRSYRPLIWAVAVLAATAAAAMPANAEALLVIEAETGKVLHAENAGQAWYPASVTKLMTTYSVLRAVKEGRLKLETSVKVSPAAAAQQPVKMGFPVGTIVTVDNALKMMMVRSSNDMAVVLAEAVSGSIEGFADEMNRNARRLGMIQSTFVNPNGLPADDQITSARDMAILARALIKEFPEHDQYWHIPAIKMGKTVMRNYNSLIGRYPGADGMKTGFICASGFNLVASATRNDKRLIAVVMGASSSQSRALKAAQLLERGFNSNNGLGWLVPSLGTVENIPAVDAPPPNLREDMCGAHRKRQATEDEDEALGANVSADSPYAVFLSSLRAPKTKGAPLMQEGGAGEPVVVYIGPHRKPGEPIPMTEPPTAKPKVAAKPKANGKADGGGKAPAGGKTAASNASGADSDASAKPKPKAKGPAAKAAPKQPPQTNNDAAKQSTLQPQ
jgi:D-alanyl-D-alanine carboxypeptidase